MAIVHRAKNARTENKSTKEKKVPFEVPPASVDQWIDFGAVRVMDDDDDDENKNKKDDRVAYIYLPPGWTRCRQGIYRDTSGHERVVELGTLGSRMLDRWRCEFFTVDESIRRAEAMIRDEQEKQEQRNAQLVAYTTLVTKSRQFFNTPCDTPIRRGDINACQHKLAQYIEANSGVTIDFYCICTMGPLSGHKVRVYMRNNNDKWTLTYMVFGPFHHTHDTDAIHKYLIGDMKDIEVESAKPNIELILHDTIDILTRSISVVLHENATRLGYRFMGHGFENILLPSMLCRGYFTLCQIRSLVDSSMTLFIGPTQNLEKDVAHIFRSDGIDISDE